MNAQRIGFSIGMALWAGITAAAFGVLIAMMLMAASLFSVLLLSILFPWTADRLVTRFGAWLDGDRATIDAVSQLVGDQWVDLTTPTGEDAPRAGSANDIRLNDGSVLCGATYECDLYDPTKMRWFWNGMALSVSDVRAYRACSNKGSEK